MSEPFAPRQPFSGEMEVKKFSHRREQYWQSISEILGMGYAADDLIHQYPAFAGAQNIARYLAIYEAYKMTLGIAGHIAEAGVWRGAVSLMLTKLTQLFEPESLTLVHGFDWFQGTGPGNDQVEVGSYAEPYERLSRLIAIQRLDHIMRIHKLDLTHELEGFFATYPHLQFKLVVLDAGIYEVVKNCLDHFWPRLTKGGVMVLDNYNHETSPGEIQAVRERLPNESVRTFPFAAQPTGYIVK